MSIKGLAKCISQLSANVCSMSQKASPAIPALDTLVCPWLQADEGPATAGKPCPMLPGLTLRAEGKRSLVLGKKVFVAWTVLARPI